MPRSRGTVFHTKGNNSMCKGKTVDKSLEDHPDQYRTWCSFKKMISAWKGEMGQCV
jgi:hypothetical protein